MAFRVQDFDYTLTKDWLNKFKSNDSSRVPFTEWEEIEEFAKYLNGKFYERYGIVGDVLDITKKCTCISADVTGDKVRFKFKKVKSSGPFVGFLGLYLDVSSGYFLLSRVKKEEYYPIINFYKFLNENGCIASPEYIVTLIERFKIGDINIPTLTEELYKGSGLSIISTLINREDTGMTEEIPPEFLLMPSLHAGSITIPYLALSVSFVSKFYSELDKDFPELGGLFREFIYMGKYLNSLRDTITEEFVPPAEWQGGAYIRPLTKGAFSRLKKNRFDSSLTWALSSMTQTDYISSDSLTEIPKSVALVLNIHDIAEVQGADVALEFAIAESNQPKIAKQVIDKLGVNEYLTGHKKSSITTGIKREETSSILDIAARNNKTLDYLSSYAGAFNTGSVKPEYQHDFEKNVYLLNKVFRKMKKILR